MQVDFAGAADELAALYLRASRPSSRPWPAWPRRRSRQAALVHDLTEFFRNEYAAGGVRYDYLLVRATVA